MSIRFQHYVPQVYLRAWESKVVSIKEPKKEFMGVYYFEKDKLEIGDGRNVKSILGQYNTYTIGYEYSFLFDEMPLVADDYGKKILEVLEKHNAVAFYNSEEISTIQKLVSMDTFPYLDEWEFYKKDNTNNLARKKSIIKDIKNIHSYVIENKLDDFLEKNWSKIRDDFIHAVEEKTDKKTYSDVKIDSEKTNKMIYAVLLLMCRNPKFDCLGIFPKIGDTLRKLCSIDNELNEDQKENTQNIIEKQLHAAWLAEIYKGLFQNESGFCCIFVEAILERCQLVLFRCPQKNGAFITSDNPAFKYVNNITKENRNSIYMPLTPEYLLAFGIEKSNIGCVDMHVITNEGVKFFNKIIYSKATNAIVSNNKYLGYIL